MRFPIKILKHLPYQMATLYFILFIISIVASVITVNCGDQVFKTYTSCHGSRVYSINWIGIVFALQILFSFVSINPEPNKKQEEEDEDQVMDLNEEEESRNLRFSLRESMSIYSRTLSNDVCQVTIESPRKKKKKSKPKTQIIGSEVVYEGSEGDLDHKSSYAYFSDTSMTSKFNRARDVIKRRVRICWSSIWMVSYNFVIFMGVHGSVLASRIHANISLNRFGIETCPHLTYVPLNLTSPYLKAPILSESVFLVTYLSFTIHEIVIRKTENCFLIKNFFGKHYFKESVILGWIRLIMQIILFCADISIIILSVSSGFGTPMHVLVGFSISMLALWINALLSQLLELTHYGEMKAPTLEYSYIWSILSAFVLWFCGFFYYTSVYGVPYKRIYFYLNPISWIILIALTHFKRHEVFNASQYLQGFVPTFT